MLEPLNGGNGLTLLYVKFNSGILHLNDAVFKIRVKIGKNLVRKFFNLFNRPVVFIQLPEYQQHRKTNCGRKNVQYHRFPHPLYKLSIIYCNTILHN